MIKDSLNSAKKLKLFKKYVKKCFPSLGVTADVNITLRYACIYDFQSVEWKRQRDIRLAPVEAHLSAAIIPYHGNQFGSPPQMTNTAISVQLLERLSKLDRWIPFPLHWQIVSGLHWVIRSSVCVFPCVCKPTVPIKGNPPHPPTFRPVSIRPPSQ